MKQFIRDLEDGNDVDTQFIVQEQEIRKKRNGEDFLQLTLGDSSGTVRANIWEDVEKLTDASRKGNVVNIKGRYAVSDKYGPQIKIIGLEHVPDEEAQLSDLLERPTKNTSSMEGEFRELVSEVKNAHLRTLLDRLFDPEGDLWQRFAHAPAAKFFHEAYEHGLLEHTLSVSQGVSAASACFPGIDHDLALTGALLHDIGKVDAYQQDRLAIDLTDAGRLQGEIPMGYYRLRRAIEDIPDFPEGLAQELLHILLSHHGVLEHGSPVVPCTREANLVHLIDKLGGKLGSFNRLEKQLGKARQWSSWDKAIEGAAYFADRSGSGSD